MKEGRNQKNFSVCQCFASKVKYVWVYIHRTVDSLCPWALEVIVLSCVCTLVDMISLLSLLWSTLSCLCLAVFYWL
jgi:hypothetical protein